MKTLHLTLKGQWYTMIESGTKTEEYREIKPYWVSRLMQAHPPSVIAGGDLRDRHSGINHSFKEIEVVHFKWGYMKHAPEMSFKCLGVSFGTGNPDWGAEPGKQYFVIRLGERLS